MFKKLFSKIGSFFSDLFNGAAKAWHKLSPEVQNSLLHGSAIVKAINDNINATPDFILDIVQKKFPNLPLDKIKAGLQKVAEGLNVAEGINTDDLLALIKALQDYLATKTKNGTTWAAISHTIASIFAIAVAPKGTKFAVVSSLLEYVYHRFIKHDQADDDLSEASADAQQ
jgi:hypothetical protein